MLVLFSDSQRRVSSEMDSFAVEDKSTDTQNHPGLQDELGNYALWLVSIVIDHLGAGQSIDTLPQLRWSTATEMKLIEIVEVSWGLPKERQHVKLNVVYVFVVLASVHNRRD